MTKTEQPHRVLQNLHSEGQVQLVVLGYQPERAVLALNIKVNRENKPRPVKPDLRLVA